MLAMSTMMLPAPGMTASAMSAPGLLPVPSKLEVAGKLTINHAAAASSAAANKAGMCYNDSCTLGMCYQRNVQHVAIQFAYCYIIRLLIFLRSYAY